MKRIPRSTFRRWLQQSGIKSYWNDISHSWNPGVTFRTISELARTFSVKSNNMSSAIPESINFPSDDISVVSKITSSTVQRSTRSVQCDDFSILSKPSNAPKSVNEIPSVGSEKSDGVVNAQSSDHMLMITSLLDYYRITKVEHISVRNFVKKYPGLSRRTFQRWLTRSGLMEASEEDAEPLIKKWVQDLVAKKYETGRLCGIGNRMFTDNEEKYILSTTQRCGEMGKGLRHSDLKKVAHGISGSNPSDAMLRDMRKRHPEIKLSLRAPKLLDHARAKQAKDIVRNVFFQNFEDVVRLLYEAGISPWEGAHEVPAECIFNMDEVGVDSTKGYSRIYCAASDCELKLSHAFVQSRGDKMGRHITLCITSCANGEQIYSVSS